MLSDQALLDSARGTYMVESRGMLQQLESSLLTLEIDPEDRETLNAAFRAAHTIKGSSSLFGFESVVAFTHRVEALMDAMRAGCLRLNDEIMAVLLRARDQIEGMLDEIADGAADASPADDRLMQQLQSALTTVPLSADQAKLPDGPVPPESPNRGDTEGIWHLSLRFQPDALRNGLDPLSFLQYLPRIGRPAGIATLSDDVPPLQALDPESCHLGFEIRLETIADRATIESVFEFALSDCTLQIIPPGSRVEEYLRLLGEDEHTVEQNLRLGELLISVGALTSTEVQRLLDRQRQLVREGGQTRLGELAQREADVPPRVVEAAMGRQDKLRSRRADESLFLRVPADKLDHLIDLIGELVIAGSGARVVAQQEGSSRFAEACARIDGLVEDVRESAMQLRMVPIGETFARFQRVVRDNAKKLGKRIELEVSGGETELDKSMVELIADPLMHLVRNSIDHGLEAPDERQAHGKPPVGRLRLNAWHEVGAVVIEVSDDGRGLNRARIVAKAVQHGLVAEDAVLSNEEIDQLIFAPGFSTAEQVTDISGRGVGMDVVHRNIAALRGSVQVYSDTGAGTRTVLRVPLTLAIIDGFMVLIGATHYIVPLQHVLECIEDQDCGVRDPASVDDCVDLRGEVLPVLDMRSFFGCPFDGRSTRQRIVVVRQSAHRLGLRVDSLLGECKTVIKPLGQVFQGLHGIAGATLLGSGEVALILDPAALAERMRPSTGRDPRHAP